MARVVEEPPARAQPGHIDRHMHGRRIAGLDALERSEIRRRPTIGEIAAGCALGYIDFRLPDLDWRASRPKLAAWYARFCAISSP